MQPYQKASSGLLIWMAFALGGVLFQVLVVYLILFVDPSRGSIVWAIIFGCLPLFFFIAGGFWFTARANRQRVAALAARLEGQGFNVWVKPTGEEKNQFARPIKHLMPALSLRTEEKGLSWIASERQGRFPILVFEHRHIVGSGKNAQEIFNTLVAWPTGHPQIHTPALSTLPWVYLEHATGWARRPLRQHEVKDAALVEAAKELAIIGHADTAKRFLQPNALATLSTTVKGEYWGIGAGWVVAGVRARLDAENLERFLQHARSIL